MVKVKIFNLSNNVNSDRDKINSWFEENKSIEIISINTVAPEGHYTSGKYIVTYRELINTTTVSVSDEFYKYLKESVSANA